ncbi:hypothetical protein IAU60_001740 [Kwoniella sp. DSM 27419]
MTRNLLIYTLALSALAPSHALRQGSHQLRDLYAYPKYDVQFLNDLPLAKSDAERCTVEGVSREEDWISARPGTKRRLSDGSADRDPGQREDRLELVSMNFAHPEEPHGPPYPYLCLMPPSNITTAQVERMNAIDEVVEEEVDPVQGWAALSHLEGKCLYSTQGWFTYAYCHNAYIRQFHQGRHPHPHPPGGFTPTEDPTYDAYTLGQVRPGARARAKAAAEGQSGPGAVRPNTPGGGASQQALVPKAAIDGVGQAQAQARSLPATSPDRDHTSPAVSYGHGPTSRYLVQRWSHGTRCDKTGRPREVEVQVHCSMTTGDMIYMIKEISICHYVMIIHSPYLCDLPGFKSRDMAEVESAGIRCRQVVEDHDYLEWEAERDAKERAGRRVQDEARLGLPFGKRPTGADNPLMGVSGDQVPTHHFGLEPSVPQPPPESESLVDGDASEVDLGDVEVLYSGEDLDHDQLRDILRKALDKLGQKGAAAGGAAPGTPESDDGEQVIFYSWEEGEDGEAVLIDADLVLVDDDDEVTDGSSEAKVEAVKADRAQQGTVDQGHRSLESVIKRFLREKGSGDKSPDGKDGSGDSKDKQKERRVKKDEL